MESVRAGWGIGLAGLMCVAAGAAAGCGSAAPGDRAAGAKPFVTASAGGCGRVRPAAGPTREGEVLQGSSVALARNGKTLVAYVADQDERRINLVDVHKGEVLGGLAVEGTPEQLLVLADGRVLVSLIDTSHVDVLEPTGEAASPLELRCRLALPAGPFGLAASPSGDAIVVTSAYDAALTVLDPVTLAPQKVFRLPRSPRGVLLDDRSRAFVTHLVGGKLSVVGPSIGLVSSVDLRVRASSQEGEPSDLATLRAGSQAFALVSVEVTRGGRAAEKPDVEGQAPVAQPAPAPQKSRRLVVPMVSVDPGDRGRPTQFYYGPPPLAGIPKQTPMVMIVDPVAEKPMSTHVLATTGEFRSDECLLPRAAAFRASSERLYVACLGVDRVLELDARAADPMRAPIRRFDVAPGPTGIAISEADGLAVVAGQFDGRLARISLSDGAVALIELPRTHVMNEADRLGRELFYRTDDKRIAADGVACASCHPDGGDDGITWSTPEGPRNTLMLAGRVTGTAPYGWTRGELTLDGYIADTTRRLGGTRLGGDELASLASYLKKLPRPPLKASDREGVERGHRAFVSRGCVSCHTDFEIAVPDQDIGSPSQDVGSKGDGDWVKAFDTPSLTGVGLSAPYYHDGRYRSLQELLSDTRSGMGAISELTPDDRTSIGMFLESL